MEDAQTKFAEWLEKNNFNENGFTYVYALNDSYEIKEELKAAGFRFSKELLWHIPSVPEQYADKCIEIGFNQVGSAAAWGEGFYHPDVRKIVDQKCQPYRPQVEHYSNWIGEKKERLRNIKCVLKSVRQIETKYGLTQLIIFEDENRNIFNWWTNSIIDAEDGAAINLSGTVKEHIEYNGEKITVLSRCLLK